MKIKYKLVYLPGLFLALFLLAVLISVFYQVKQNLNNTMLDVQRLLVESNSQNVDEYMGRYIGLVTYLQTVDAIKDMSEYGDISTEFKGLSDQQGVAIRHLFRNALDTYPDLAYLATYTKEDAINVIYEPYIEQLGLKEEDYLRGFSYRDWYAGAMSTLTTYTSEAYMSASIFKPVVAISTPIFVGGDIKGIMIGALKLTTLSEKLSELRFGSTGHSYIVDNNNQIVAHPDPVYFEENRLFMVENSGVIDIIRRSENAEPPDKLLKAYDSLSGNDVYFYYSRMERTGWTVITQISADEVQAPILHMYRTIALPSMVIISLFLVLIFLSVRRVVRRIEFLSQISESIGDQDFEIPSDERSYIQKHSFSSDESHLLLKNFESMIDRLKHSFKNADFLASHDYLTGLPNRRSFYSDTEAYMKSGGIGAIIMIDLDDFKIILTESAETCWKNSIINRHR